MGLFLGAIIVLIFALNPRRCCCGRELELNEDFFEILSEEEDGEGGGGGEGDFRIYSGGEVDKKGEREKMKSIPFINFPIPIRKINVSLIEISILSFLNNLAANSRSTLIIFLQIIFPQIRNNFRIEFEFQISNVSQSTPRLSLTTSNWPPAPTGSGLGWPHSAGGCSSPGGRRCRRRTAHTQRCTRLGLNI